MRFLMCCSLAALLALLPSARWDAAAEELYIVKPLSTLKVTEGELPDDVARDADFVFTPSDETIRAYVVLEGEGEAYVVYGAEYGEGIDLPNPRIAVRLEHRRDVRGRLFLPRHGGKGMVSLRFQIPADEGRPNLSDAFLRTKQTYYETLSQFNIAGAAWFRHQAREAAHAQGAEPNGALTRRGPFGTWETTELESTLALASGGRAVSENLQLGRIWPASEAEEASVPLNSIEGITVREFDWESLIRDQTQLDSLADLIPDDQHAMFFSSYAALVRLADAAQQQGTPLLYLAESRAEDALSLERYERQLCLPRREVEQLFSSQLIESIALTGGDPYFRTGTDVAILFEAKNPRLLREMIDARIALGRKERPEAQAVEGEIAGVLYTGARSPDREICCYVASLDQVVIVANSLQQLTRIMAVSRGDGPALAALPEYAFFRQRYPARDAEESAFLVISDKTIRRWCGPQWRIAASRRTLAAAVMAEVQAAHLQRLVEENVESPKVQSAFWVPEAEAFALSTNGVSSTVYGNLRFQTPINELEMAYVTSEEANLYRRWRDGYQANWSQFFDPIAVRFSLTDDKLAIDLTVMPLIASSEYREWIGMSQGSKLEPHHGDPHSEAILHWAAALNPDSAVLQSLGLRVGGFLGVDPLSWVDGWAAVFADRDPFWNEWVAADDPRQFLGNNLHRMPVGMHVSVRSGANLLVFLVALRAFIETTAPGMTVWEPKSHNGEPYVKVSPSARALEEARDDFTDQAALYYSASGQGLIVSLSESVLQRALDRQQTRAAASDKLQPLVGMAPWIGDHFSLQLHRDVLPAFQAALEAPFQETMQNRAWGNLYILNEWKRRFPKYDPLALHERFWGVRPVCPGGGQYIWNEPWQTYESTVYGHPGEPKKGQVFPASLRNMLLGNFGLTFEEDGLRGRVEMSFIE